MKTVRITLTLHPATEAFIASEMLYTNAEHRTFRRRGGFEILDQTVSRQRLAVIVLRRTLEKLKQPCKVYVTINSHYVWTNAEKLATWQHQDWTNASGKPIANAYSWQELAQAVKQQTIQHLEGQGKPCEHIELLWNTFDLPLTLGQIREIAGERSYTYWKRLRQPSPLTCAM